MDYHHDVNSQQNTQGEWRWPRIAIQYNVILAETKYINDQKYEIQTHAYSKHSASKFRHI